MAECVSIIFELLLNLETDVSIPASTFKNAKKYWTAIICCFLSCDIVSSLGLKTAKPPTPVILDMIIHGYDNQSFCFL